MTSKVKFFRNEAAGKPSLKWAIEFVAFDPKPGDLPMSRLKWR